MKGVTTINSIPGMLKSSCWLSLSFIGTASRYPSCK